MSIGSSDIIIRYRNELKCVVEADKSILYSIKDKFSYFVKGYQYNPRYRSGGWDGKISMIDYRNREFYIGLLPALFNWAKSVGYTISIHKDDINEFKTKLKYDKETSNYFKDVVPKIGKFTPKDYQIKYVEEALLHNKLTLLSPTGSGKSYIIYLIIRYLLLDKPNDKILINVPSINLVEQLFSDFKDYVNDDFDVDLNCERIYSGSPDAKLNKNAKLVISTWQSCKNKQQDFFDDFSSFIVDECFTPDTKVLTPNGYKEISLLNIGDKIINYSESEKTFKEDKIVKVHTNLKKSENDKIIKLTFENGKEVRCTENHEFLTECQGWVKAKDLTEEMEIVDNVE